MVKDLPLNALRAFAVVWSEGGVRSASRALGIAHSSVSRHLAELESWLGVQLIEKAGGSKGIGFTRAGAALGEATARGLNEIATAVASLRESRSSNSVMLAAAPSFATLWLLPRLPVLEAAHPSIELSMFVDQRTADLDQAGIDLAVRMGKGPWPGVHAEPLMSEQVFPVASPAYWQQIGNPDDVSGLRRARLLHDRDPQTTWESWRQQFGPAELDVRRGPRYASTDLLLRAAAQGQGVALARGVLAAEYLESGRLINPFPGKSIDIGTAYWIVRPDHGLPRRSVKLVMDWLKGQARAEQARSTSSFQSR